MRRGWFELLRVPSDGAAHLTGMETITGTASVPPGGLEPLLTAEDFAAYLGIPVSTVRDWRSDGQGPCGVWVGKHLRYMASDVRAWLAEQRELRPGQLPEAR